MIRNYLLLFYFVIGVLEVFGEAFHNEWLCYAYKPCLMPILIWFYVYCTWRKMNSMHWLMIAAFVFSWFGDVALLFVQANPNFFLLGLVGFLITHVLYLVSFLKVENKNAVTILQSNPKVFIPIALYFVGLMGLLVMHLGEMLIPVAVYSTAIAAMVITAVNRYNRVNAESFKLVAAGALLFMFSDSCIALNKFLHPFFGASVLIMLLYIVGQYLIAEGMLKQEA